MSSPQQTVTLTARPSSELVLPLMQRRLSVHGSSKHVASVVRFHLCRQALRVAETSKVRLLQVHFQRVSASSAWQFLSIAYM